MHVFRNVDDVRAAEPQRPIWATLGTFDGLLKGHRYLIAELLQCARQWVPAAVSLVITFEVHPKVVLAHDPPTPILSPDHKLLLLQELGVDATLMLTFDEELASIPAEVFVQQWLGERLGVSGVLLGYDARFGHRAKGDFALLERMAPSVGFVAARGEEVHVAGAPVSSTRIRHALARCDLAAAQQLLGRPYSALGTVVHGQQRGRTIGFPTANLSLVTSLPVPRGVYGVRVRRLPSDVAPAQTVWGLANLGLRPTVDPGATVPVLEVHLLDFQADLYGRMLEVEFLSRIREEQTFASLDQLKAQIAQDRETFRAWIREHESSLSGRHPRFS